VVPATVLKEVEYFRVGAQPGWEGTSDLPDLVPDAQIPPEVKRHALDPGEAMVLAVALADKAAGEDVEVVIDERKGRQAALALDLPVIGTAGLLILGKRCGQVREVRPLLDELERQGMYLGNQLRRDILDLANE
jgi:predicted nucleic acid-binding protein